MTANLHRWEAFSMPEALTHTRITWALSPMAPQILGVTSGSPLCPCVVGTPREDVHDMLASLDLNALHK